MKFCPNCGKKIPKGTRFCTNCGYKFAENRPVNYVHNTHSINQSYLSKLVNSSFISRLTTGLPIVAIICALFGFIVSMVAVPIMVSMNSSAVTMFIQIFLVISSAIELFLLWFFISRHGLSIIDRWLTPKYYRHLFKYNPSYTSEEINNLAVKHLMITANISRFICYVFIAIVVIMCIIAFTMYMLGLLILLVIFGGIRISTGYRWHFWPKGIFFPTHWYYSNH